VREDGRIIGGEEWQGKIYNREEFEEAPENGKELSHSAHANGIIERMSGKLFVNLSLVAKNVYQ
jgi:hypothetical protein